MLNQARTAGMGGFLGFDYAVLPFICKAKDIPASEWEMLLEKLQVVQSIAVTRLAPD